MDLFGYALNFTMELSSAIVEAKSQDSEANSLKMLLKKHTVGTGTLTYLPLAQQLHMKSNIIIKDFIMIIKDLSVFRILVKTQLYCSKKEALESDTNTMYYVLVSVLPTFEEVFDFPSQENSMKRKPIIIHKVIQDIIK